MSEPGPTVPNRSRLASLLAQFRRRELSARTVLLWAFLLASAWFLASVEYSRSFNDPPEPYDGPDYDMIGLCLAKGYGYGCCWNDPDYRRIYEKYVRFGYDKEYGYLLQRQGGFASTTYRPPFLPLALAGIYKSVGRQFWVWRVCACLFMGGAVAAAAALGYVVLGPGVAALTLAWGVLDSNLANFAAAYMTEAPATFGTAVLFVLLVRLLQRPTALDAVLAGAALGFLVLVRSVFVLWYVPLGILLWLAFRWRQRRGLVAGISWRKALLLLLIPALLVPLPWWVRNCHVLGEFMPLGTQGKIALPGGYSWRAVFAHGQWSKEPEDEIRQALLKQNPELAANPLAFEREVAHYAQAVAIDWTIGHLHRIPQLVWDRVRRLWTPQSTYESLLFVCALCGAWVLLGQTWTWPLLALLGLETLVVAGTYCDGGRYLLPLHPALHLLAAFGRVALYRWAAHHIAWMRGTLLRAGPDAAA